MGEHLYSTEMWLDNAFVTDGDELLSETLKYVLHKATLATIGEDLSNEVDKALNVYFTEEMDSQIRKLNYHRNPHARYFASTLV